MRAPVDTLALQVAGAERKAFRLQRLGHFEQALQSSREADRRRRSSAGDTQRRAWLAAIGCTHRLPDERRGARSEAADPRLLGQQQSFAAQGAARLCRRGRCRASSPRRSSRACSNMISRGAMIADFDEAVAELVPDGFGRPLRGGARQSRKLILASRPSAPRRSTGKGPMCCGGPTPPSTSSSRRKARRKDNPLYKNDHAQLLEAEAWFKSAYPAGRPYGYRRCPKRSPTLANIQIVMPGEIARAHRHSGQPFA